MSCVVFPTFFEVRRSVLECLSSATNRLSIPGSNDAYWDATVHKYAKDVIQGRYHIKHFFRPWKTKIVSLSRQLARCDNCRPCQSQPYSSSSSSSHVILGLYPHTEIDYKFITPSLSGNLYLSTLWMATTKDSHVYCTATISLYIWFLRQFLALTHPQSPRDIL